MINGIIKLFYSEVVKSKMKKMPSEEYSLRDEYKGISSIFTKIDNIFGNIFKVLFSIIIVLISLNINIIFGVGTAFIIILYSIYKLYIENKIKDQFRDSVGNIKNNIEQTSQNDVILTIKPKIYSLIALLLIGVFSDFNLIIIACFTTVLIFTIKDIYSNINK